MEIVAFADTIAAPDSIYMLVSRYIIPDYNFLRQFHYYYVPGDAYNLTGFLVNRSISIIINWFNNLCTGH